MQVGKPSLITNKTLSTLPSILRSKILKYCRYHSGKIVDSFGCWTSLADDASASHHFWIEPGYSSLEDVSVKTEYVRLKSFPLSRSTFATRACLKGNTGIVTLIRRRRQVRIVHLDGELVGQAVIQEFSMEHITFVPLLLAYQQGRAVGLMLGGRFVDSNHYYY